MRISLLSNLVLCASISAFAAQVAFSQLQNNSEQVLSNGLRQLRSNHLTIITDLPVDDEIRGLLIVFEAALPQWAMHFKDSGQRWQSWNATLYLMVDKRRFHEYLGRIPDFKNGFQAGDKLFVVEQPSTYFRRHEMLHEGTHWFMEKLLSGAGPPWYMEGTAEQLATHLWNSSHLTLGVIPKESKDFPYWGRLRLIHDDLASDSAPSLESILGYNNRAHLENKPYAWSWAAVLFFSNHPDYRDRFQTVGHGPLDYSNRLTFKLRESIGNEWSQVRAAWQGFISDLDYGYDPVRAMPSFKGPISKMSGQSVKLKIEADRGWQSSGILMQAGESVQITADGQYSVGNQPKPWLSEPQGITLRYHRGQPIGMLLATVAELSTQEPTGTTRWETIPIGRKAELRANRAGVLLFKINESAANLADNAGQIDIEVH